MGCTNCGSVNSICTCSDNCPNKTSDITLFDGSFNTIEIPCDASLNDVLTLLESYTTNMVNELSEMTSLVISEPNCIGLVAGTYSVQQVINAVNTILCDVKTDITTIENEIVSIEGDIVNIQGDITDIENAIDEGAILLGESMPLGSIVLYPTAVPPNSKWLVCEGQSIPKASYPDLFNIIGYTFGGSGIQFNLPDFQKKFIVGYDGGGSANYQVIGQGAGSNSVTLTGPQSGVSPHTHPATTNITINSGGEHSHSQRAGDGLSGGGFDIGEYDQASWYPVDGPDGTHSHTGSATTTVLNSGYVDATEAHENRPEFIVFPFMMKVLP